MNIIKCNFYYNELQKNSIPKNLNFLVGENGYNIYPKVFQNLLYLEYSDSFLFGLITITLTFLLLNFFTISSIAKLLINQF